MAQTLERVDVHAEWLTDRSALAGLREEWASLAGNNAFSGFAWTAAWWDTWGHGRSLALAAVRDAGRLVGVAPFSIERVWVGCVPVRRLRFLADEHTGSDYLGVLAMPGYEEEVARAVARVLVEHRAEWDTILFQDCADTAMLADLRMRLIAAETRCHQKAAAVCYYVPLPQTPELFLKSLNSHLRCNYKRRWRVLEREAAVEFVSLEDRESVERHFGELVRLHRKRFRQRGETSAFAQPVVLEFHARFLARPDTRGARLFLLRVNGEAVAALYGFSAGRTFQFYQCGMHPEWKRRGVGQMLIGRAMEEAIRLGHTEFDFLRGGESYKAHWAEQTRETVTLRFFDARWKSRYAERVWLARTFAREKLARWKRSGEDTGDE